MTGPSHLENTAKNDLKTHLKGVYQMERQGQSGAYRKPTIAC